MTHNPDVKPVPENTIKAYVIPGVTKDVSRSIRPCKVTRNWMDDTPSRYAYRCVPLTAANSMGWEILNPNDVTLEWSGKEEGDHLHVEANMSGPFSARPHFGSGTVTWYIPFLFRTPPDYGLLITGPANQDKQNIVPLEAFVRTDWIPFPFTMNWRLTSAKTKVSFRAGEPICRIIPYPLALLNDMKMEFHSMEEDPAFMQQVKDWEVTRQQNYQEQQKLEQDWAATGHTPSMKEMWNTQYAKGRGSEGAKCPHQNIFKSLNPEDKRK